MREKPDPNALYGNDEWIAQALGRRKSWWYQNRDRLYREGFPQKDPIIGLTPKAAVEKWVANRSAVAANLQLRGAPAARTKGEINAIR